MLPKLTTLIVELNVDEAKEYASDLLYQGLDSSEILNQVMVGLSEVGERYETGEYYIADLIVAGMLATEIIDKISTNIPKEESTKIKQKVVFGTIFDDIHDIGKNIMIDVIRQRGFEVIDLGVDVEVTRFVESIRDEKPDFLCISCVMSGSMLYIKELLRTLEAKNLMREMQILVGGAAANKADAAFAKYKNVVFISNDFYAAINFFEKQMKDALEKRREVLG